MFAPDPHSFARPNEARITHLDLALTVDFDRRVLRGRVTLRVAQSSGESIVLDSKGLVIHKVTDAQIYQRAKDLPFQVGKTESLRGQPLEVALSRASLCPGVGPTGPHCIVIEYETSTDAGALLWMAAEETGSKQAPMLFTQSQALLARSWVPLQDTPSVRFTYEAIITVHANGSDNPAKLVPLMSAAKDGHRFSMKQPIPSYLMALAVGDFAFRGVTERSGVWAEPGMVEAAANEFGEIGEMMAAAEKLYGPYRWERYDMLVLPPSFPFGGMENPRLTFLTPTVINGERSLVSLIAHELAHSWSGNLVTNATWNDFWLNEGFTTYVERRVMEVLRGPDWVEFLWAWGRGDLDKSLAGAGTDNPLTKLRVTLGSGDDPEAIPWDVPYEKGALMLRALERAAGRERFDAFLRARFDRLAFQSTTTDDFVRDTEAWLVREKVEFPLAAWVDAPGLPADVPTWPAPWVDAVRAAATAFASAGTLPDAAAWTTIEWVTFMSAMGDVTAGRLRTLDAGFAFAQSPNAELATQWLPRLITADVRDALPRVERHLRKIGRRRMVMPLYEAMVKSPYWKAEAQRIFAAAAPTYHPVTRDTVADLLAGRAAHW